MLLQLELVCVSADKPPCAQHNTWSLTCMAPSNLKPGTAAASLLLGPARTGWAARCRRAARLERTPAACCRRAARQGRAPAPMAGRAWGPDARCCMISICAQLDSLQPCLLQDEEPCVVGGECRSVVPLGRQSMAKLVCACRSPIVGSFGPALRGAVQCALPTAGAPARSPLATIAH